MARRALKLPRVSVVLTARDADGSIGRAIESVLNQTLSDLELVVVDRGSRDRTRSLAERYAERDIRVEVIDAADGSHSGALVRGCAVARGAHLLFLNQRDWISPSFLDVAMACVEADGVDVVVPEFSIDSEQADGARMSSIIAHEARVWSDAASFHRAVPALVESGAFSLLAGKILDRRVLELALKDAGGFDDERGLMRSILGAIDRGSAVEGSRYHLTVAPPVRPVFDPDMFVRCVRDHEGLKGLYDSWGLLDDEASRTALYRHHLRDIVRCIENASVGSGAITSNERREVVQDIIDAPSTRACVDALRSASHEFGIIYTPIARRNAMACCMGARIQEIASRALMPSSPTTLPVNV
ncbi:MAG: glycosyltransferase family 2 protein [Collinsella sp.]|nr:glycosyltransferase family 2 protein [Collinsella sp.]